ncbi:MAG: TraR/DksA family transcriptional regulator [Flavipsychrobacter sp.]
MSKSIKKETVKKEKIDISLENTPEVDNDIQENVESEANAIVYRYSDEELNEFKELINARLEVARKELLYLQAQMRGKDASNEDRALSLEDGSAAMEREQVSQLASRQILYVNNLEKALIRIANKTYGICRQTGKLIDKARLRAVPHATLSMEAKKGDKK